MRALTQLELDTLEWVASSGKMLITSRRRKTFERLETLGGGLVMSEMESLIWRGRILWRYQLTPNGRHVLAQYAGPLQPGEET
jgi:hypothetical protein